MTRASKFPLILSLLFLTTPSLAKRWVSADFGAFDADLTFYDSGKDVVLSYVREQTARYWRVVSCKQRKRPWLERFLAFTFR
jgi:hypothetical protein